jgi:hypothetical protein
MCFIKQSHCQIFNIFAMALQQFSVHGHPDLLPPTFYILRSCHPVPYLERIYTLPPNNIFPLSLGFPTGLLPETPAAIDLWR